MSNPALEAKLKRMLEQHDDTELLNRVRVLRGRVEFTGDLAKDYGQWPVDLVDVFGGRGTVTTNELPRVEIPRQPESRPSEGIRIRTENPWRLR